MNIEDNNHHNHKILQFILLCQINSNNQLRIDIILKLMSIVHPGAINLIYSSLNKCQNQDQGHNNNKKNIKRIDHIIIQRIIKLLHLFIQNQGTLPNNIIISNNSNNN